MLSVTLPSFYEPAVVADLLGGHSLVACKHPHFNAGLSKVPYARLHVILKLVVYARHAYKGEVLLDVANSKVLEVSDVIKFSPAEDKSPQTLTCEPLHLLLDL